MTTLEFIAKIMKWDTSLGNINLHTSSIWPGLQVEHGGPKPLEDTDGAEVENEIRAFLLDENKRFQKAVTEAVEDSAERIESFLKEKGWEKPS